MRKVLQQLLFISALAILITSCEKGEEEFPPVVKSQEKTLVSFPDAVGGPFMTLAIDLVPGVAPLTVLEIQRDTKTPAELAQPLTVKIRHQNALIADASSGEVRELPRDLYTNHPDNPFDGQYWTVTFKPNEQKAYIKILIDASVLLSLPNRVGLGFQIAEVGPGAEISNSKGQLGVEISAKNNWDGTYAVRGPVVDIFAPDLLEWTNQPGYTSPAWLLAHPGAWEAHLITVSATDCIVFDNTVWGEAAIPLFNRAAVAPTPPNTGYGGFGLIVTFDPATNKVAKVRNYYGDPTAGPANILGNPATGSGPPLYQASNTRYAQLDPTGTNAVQGNRDINIKYFMFHPAAVPVGPRTTFTQHFEYIGPR
jgi:hypothetical protein